MAYATNVLL